MPSSFAASAGPMSSAGLIMVVSRGMITLARLLRTVRFACENTRGPVDILVGPQEASARPALRFGYPARPDGLAQRSDIYPK
jgi:hypothetical protein